MPTAPPPLTRRAFVAGAGAALPVAAAAAPAAAQRAPGTTAAGERRRTRIGTYGGAGCDGVPRVAAFETWLGRPLDIVVDFCESRRGWEQVLSSAQWIARCWAPTRYALTLSVPMLPREGDATLARGAAGEYDRHYRRLAESLVEAAQSRTVIRLGWEFNADWYRWSAKRDPAAFTACWRRAVAAMRGVPGARFRFDWCPNIGSAPAAPAWPGDDVVDIVGLDAYNQSWPRFEDAERRWQHLMDHPTGLRWHREFAEAHGKPRSFPEWGTGTRPDGHGGGDDPLFVRNMLAWMREGGPVDYMCYWNYRAGDFDGLLTDGRQPAAAAALREGLRAGI